MVWKKILIINMELPVIKAKAIRIMTIQELRSPTNLIPLATPPQADKVPMPQKSAIIAADTQKPAGTL